MVCRCLKNRFPERKQHTMTGRAFNKAAFRFKALVGRDGDFIRGELREYLRNVLDSETTEVPGGARISAWSWLAGRAARRGRGSCLATWSAALQASGSRSPAVTPGSGRRCPGFCPRRSGKNVTHIFPGTRRTASRAGATRKASRRPSPFTACPGNTADISNRPKQVCPTQASFTETDSIYIQIPMACTAALFHSSSL